MPNNVNSNCLLFRCTTITKVDPKAQSKLSTNRCNVVVREEITVALRQPALSGLQWSDPARMKVYHSTFIHEEGITKACGCPLLPLKSHIRGPAPVSDQDRTDIVDEAITFFRANVFFRNFDIQSSADKLLIYLTFYINVALKRLEGCRTLAEGTKAIINLGLEEVPVPGESGFPFPGLFVLPQARDEAELFRNYLKQIREETSGRLLSVAYRPNGTPNKWWLAFAKRKFMNIIAL